MADGYISQIKTPDNKVYDFRDQHLKVYTGSCTTAAGTAIKDVTTDGEFTLAKGAVIFVNFSTTNTAAVADLKLRVNSNAANDAKPIKHEYNASEANLPAAGYLRANQTYQFYYDGTNWVTDVGRDANSTYSYMRPYENTGKGSYNSQGKNPAKTGSAGWRFQLSAGKYFMYSHYYDNTAKSALTLNIGSTGAKPIYINGQPSSADNYTLPGGQYLVYYDGTNYYFRTDDKMTGNITGNAATASSIALSGVTGADDLKAIEAISGTTGLLKKTAANTWTLDTNTYLTTHRTYTAVSGKKPTGNQTPGFGSTFDIEQVGQDTTGQVSVTERTVKIPDTAASTSTAGLVTTETQTLGGRKTLKFTSRIYPLIGASAERSHWYKITFPYYNATTTSSAKWFMNSFDLHFGGGYNSNPSGVAHVIFYWTRAANNGAWTVGQQAAFIEGTLANKIGLYYRIAEPGVLYVNNTANVYNGIWIDNLYVDDTAPSLDWSTTKIENVAAITNDTDPALSAYTKLTTTYLYNDNGVLKTNAHFEGQYIKGTWLYTSAATAKTSTAKLATIESDNFIYYITPANALKSAIGATTIGGASTPIYWDGSAFTAGTALSDGAYKSILNNTSVSALGWNSGGNTNADNLRLVNVNTIAYWNGAYSGTTSNLTYYKGGAFGTMAKETATDYAKLASPTFTGTPKAPTAANGTSTTQIATTEFVNNTLAYANAMTFKGTLGTGGTITALPASHNAGDTYRIITAGTWAGKYCEVGTLIICTTDGTAANDAHWTSVETNEDGAVIGPSSSTDNAIVRFDGATGRIVQNSGVIIDDSNNVTIPGVALKVTAESGGKYILLGNQNSYGENCPVILEGVNGSLYIGNGTSWSSNTGGTLNTALFMSKDRKIGIGTTSPAYLLDVNGTGRFSSELTLYREGTTAQNYPARITFTTKDTDKNQSNTGYIAYYNDHSTTYNGNLVMSSGGTTFVGAGESAATLYSTLGTTYNSENLFLTADSNVFIYAYADTAANRVGFKIDTNGHVIPVKADSANNNKQDLGASSNKWANIYATNLNGNLSVTAHTNATNGSKNYYPWFSTATSGNLGARAHAGIYIHETVTSGAISSLDFCVGSRTITGSIALWDGTNHYGNIKPVNLSANRSYVLPNQAGTFALLTQTDANALINLLDTGSSDLTANDYVITQYVGGGTTTTSYHRRPASKVINATLVKGALGTDSSTTNQWLNKKGLWSTPTAAEVGAITKLNSSTDNAIVRFDGTSGQIQDSKAILDDNGNAYFAPKTIGGRNYIYSTPITGGRSTIEGKTVVFNPNANNGDSYFYVKAARDIPVGTYTFSMDCEGLGANEVWTFGIISQNSGKVISVKNGRSALTFEVTTAITAETKIILDDISRPTTSTRVVFSNFMWEAATSPSDFSYAPEEIESTYVKRITSTKYGIAYYSDTTGTFAGTGAGTSGQYLKSNGNSAPTWATFSASTVGLGNVENTKLSTWAGSSNITTVGTISTGTWHGTKIANDYIANPKVTIAGNDISLGGSLTAATLTSSLGLSNALHFIGITSTILADGSVTATLTPKSTGSLNKTTGFVNGDVVMDSDQLREYVWSGDAWRLLGITTSSAYTQPTSTATNTWIAQISQGTDGKITATTGSLDTSGTWSGNAATATAANLTSTANAVAYYTNTAGKFGSKASANGALYATSANGALQWGTLPIAQGGTGVTSFTKNHVILSDNTNGTTGLTSRAYSDSTSAGALSNSSTNFVTERDVYFGLPTLNNAHNYTSSSTYYAPTTGGTAGHILIGAGATTAPAWYGGTVMSGSAAASWKTAFNGTTDATATNAAAVTIAGGLGVSKKLHVGSTATVLNLTIGSTNEYGDAYTPIYWHEGVPTTVTLVQQCAFTIKSGKSGVKLSHAAITANSYVTQIVVTSGEANLNSAISWTSAAGYIELTCSSTVSGDVTGYIMISRGGEITATATDIT